MNLDLTLFAIWISVHTITYFCNYSVAGTDLPENWIAYVQEITAKFDREPWAAVCLEYAGITDDHHGVIPNFTPDVILWNPLVQIPIL